MKQLIIGLGTGRCGTQSLAKFLDRQADMTVSHEARPLLPWNTSKVLLDRYLVNVTKPNTQYVGDVALYALPYAEFILHRYPASKLIVLQRAMEETVESFLRKVSDEADHWRPVDCKYNRGEWLWRPCFPKYTVDTKQEALERYWHEYYARCYRLQHEHPKRVLWLNTVDLNSATKLHGVLDFIGYPKNPRVIFASHTNRTTTSASYLTVS